MADDDTRQEVQEDIHSLLEQLKEKVDIFSVSQQLGVKLCPINQRVLVYADRHPSIPGQVVGYAFHEMPGTRNRMGISCVIRLDQPYDAPHGLYVRFILVPHGGFEPAA